MPLSNSPANLHAAPSLAAQIKAKKTELLDGDFDSPLVLEGISKEELLAEDGAMTSYLIEVLWEQMRASESNNLEAVLDKHRGCNELELGVCLVNFATENTNRISLILEQRLVGDPAQGILPTPEFQSIDRLRFRSRVVSAALRGDKKFAEGFPVLDDLFNFELPYLRLIKSLYKAKYKTEISPEKFVELAASSKAVKLFQQMQINTTKGAMPFFFMLMGVIKPEDLDRLGTMAGEEKYAKATTGVDGRTDSKRIFLNYSPDYFELNEDDTEVKLKDGVVEEYKRRSEAMFRSRSKKVTGGIKQVNCPLIYTKLFPEMWYWLLRKMFIGMYGLEMADKLVSKSAGPKAVQTWCSASVDAATEE